MKTYRVKTKEELLATGWKESEFCGERIFKYEGAMYYFAMPMLMFGGQTVTQKSPPNGKIPHLSHWTWIPEMFVEVKTKPDWL